MRRLVIMGFLMTLVTAGHAANPAKAPTAVTAKKVPSEEKLSCRTGPNDEQVRLIVQAVKGTVRVERMPYCGMAGELNGRYSNRFASAL